jgi:hypothetical protein
MHAALTSASPAPRQFLSPAPPAPMLPGPGMPHDRHARIAARRSFVELKRQFIAAASDLGGPRGDWLRWQVRQSQEPVDLWLLRGAVFAGLSAIGDTARRTQRELERVLDNVFPGGGELSPYMPLIRG